MSDFRWKAIMQREQHRTPSQAECDRVQTDNWRIPLTEDPSRFLYQRVYGFQLTPDPGGWGILRMDGSPRPAYRWLRAWRT
jgi:hypothetical protein